MSEPEDDQSAFRAAVRRMISATREPGASFGSPVGAEADAAFQAETAELTARNAAFRGDALGDKAPPTPRSRSRDHVRCCPS
jgi:hypothetical protein